MNNRHGRLHAILMLVCLLILPGIALADNISVSSSGVLKFQQKLAEKGNVQSQFKLATMYELGVGTSQNLDKAREWYQKAFVGGVKEAEDRLTYLDIKQNGYSHKSHGLWATKIKKNAAGGDQHALMLLGQMYSNGIGVKKDLKMAIKQLSKVDEMETPMVVHELERVEAELVKAQNAWRAKLEKDKKRKQAEEKRKREKKAQAELAKKKQTKNSELDTVVAESSRQADEAMKDIEEDDVMKQQGVSDWFEDF